MNHHTMRASVPLLVIFFFCWNGTLVDSNTKSKRPDVNFYGTIEDHTGKTFYVEDILINGKYEGIQVYPVLKKIKKRTPDKVIHEDEADVETKEVKKDSNNKQTDIDPTQNKALLDLAEVKTIELKHPEHPTASTISINQKDYIEIIVTSINGTKKNYLVETSRKVTCKEIDKGPEGNKQEVLVERELNMIHIKKLVIEGYKSIKETETKSADSRTLERTSTVDQKKDIAVHTEKILDQITENVKNLSQDNPSTFEKMKSSIISLLKSLREQLQKMLNMLQ